MGVGKGELLGLEIVVLDVEEWVVWDEGVERVVVVSGEGVE